MSEAASSVLAELEARLRRYNPAALAHARAGLEATVVRKKFAAAGLDPTGDVVSLYEWRDGSDVDLFPGARLLSLDEAIATRELELKLARELEMPPRLSAEAIFATGWFPIMQNPGGLLFVIEDVGRGRVLFVERDDPGNPEEVSASLTAFLDAIVQEGPGLRPAPLSTDVAALVSRLESESPRIRWDAVRELTRKRPKEAFEPLVAMLDSANEDARRDAALLLGSLGDQRAAPILARRLTSWTGKDATAAEAGLSRLRAASADGLSGDG